MLRSSSHNVKSGQTMTEPLTIREITDGNTMSQPAERHNEPTAKLTDCEMTTPQPTEKGYPDYPLELGFGAHVERLTKRLSVETIPAWLVVWPDMAVYASAQAIDAMRAFLLWHIRVKISGSTFGPVRTSLETEYLRQYGMMGFTQDDLDRARTWGSDKLWSKPSGGRYSQSEPFPYPEVFRRLGLVQRYSPRAMEPTALESDFEIFRAYMFNAMLSHIDYPVSRSDLQSLTSISANTQRWLQKLIAPARGDGHIIPGEANVVYRPMPNRKAYAELLETAGWLPRDGDGVMMRRTCNSYVSCHLPRVEIRLDGTIRVWEPLDHFHTERYFPNTEAARKAPTRADNWCVWDGTYTFTRQGGPAPDDPGWTRPTLRANIWELGNP
jgi:hypothetical protein